MPLRFSLKKNDLAKPKKKKKRQNIKKILFPEFGFVIELSANPKFPKTYSSFIRNLPEKSTMVHESLIIVQVLYFFMKVQLNSTIHLLNLLPRISKQKLNFINTAVLGKQT